MLTKSIFQNPNLSFKIFIKSQPHSLDQKYTSISWQNFSFNIVTKIKIQMSSKPQLQNLDQTINNTFLGINISNTSTMEKFAVGIFKGQNRSLIYIVHNILNSSSENLEFQLSECQIQFLIQNMNRVAEWDSEKSYWNPVGYRNVLGA